jgi:hypothetical protein
MITNGDFAPFAIPLGQIGETTDLMVRLMN